MAQHTIVILSGGLSPERDVSLRSGRRIADSLRGRDLDVEVMDVDDELAERLSSRRPTCVIPLVHGVAGEDGELAALISALDLPHVGSSADGCRRAFNKPTANDVVRSAGIAVPAFVVLEQQDFRSKGPTEVLADVGALGRGRLEVGELDRTRRAGEERLRHFNLEHGLVVRGLGAGDERNKQRQCGGALKAREGSHAESPR